MARNYTQGLYTPKHPEKYVGDITKIRYMSSWELELHQFFDNNNRVIKWSSETVVIPYIKPTDGKIHRYFVDYVVEYINRHGEVVTELIECKPLSQTRAPRKNGKQSVYESVQYAVNMAKWKAAQYFAEERGWAFRIVTERSVFK